VGETVQAGASTRPTEGFVSPKTDDTTGSDTTTVAEEPESQIDLRLPVDDFAAAVRTIDDPHEQLVMWDLRLRQLTADKRREAQLSRTTRQAA